MHTETLIRPSASEDTTAGMPTICAAFQATAARYPNRLALRLPGEGIEWTWDEYAARVRRAAHTLHALGVRRGDRVALLLRNRPEHLLADLAAVHLGATPFSIYATSAPPQVAYLVRDSGACVLITEAAFEATAAAVAPGCGGLEHVLRVTSGAPELDSVESPAFEFEQSWRAVTPADPVCLVYTSTTTGPPKGAEITHEGVLANLRGTWRTVHVPEGLTAVSFLPLAHLVERLTSHYSAIALAGTVTCCPDAAALALALAQTRPTAFDAPPRMWELRARCETLREYHNLPEIPPRRSQPSLSHHHPTWRWRPPPSPPSVSLNTSARPGSQQAAERSRSGSRDAPRESGVGRKRQTPIAPKETNTMTTTVAPDLKPDHAESEEWPTLGRDVTDITREEPDAHSFEPTQGRRIGSNSYDDPTQGRRIGSNSYDDPTQGRRIGSNSYDDPTQGRRIGSNSYDDPTHGRRIGSHSYDDPTHGRKIGSHPYDDTTRAR